VAQKNLSCSDARELRKLVDHDHPKLSVSRQCALGFVAEMGRIGVTPHVAQNTARTGGSAIDGGTIRHESYARSINARRGIEKVFGWIKKWGGLRQFKLRGTE